MPQLIKPEEFRFNSFQGVLFCPTAQAITGKAQGQILAQFGERFDGTPTILPIPPEAPAEFPRMILQSADSQWGVEVALSRVTFRWVQMKEEQRLAPSAFRDSFIDFFEKLIKIQPLSIGRLALLINRYILTDEAGQLISRAFLKEAVFSKMQTVLENTEVHLHRKIKVSGVNANEWIRFKSGLLNLPGTLSRNILLVEQDINTLAEEVTSKQFSPDDVKKFTDAGFSQAESRFRELLEV